MQFRDTTRAARKRSYATGTLLFVLSFMLAGLLLSANRARAQARPSPATQVISVDPVPLAYDYPLTVQYEYKADPVSSWMFRLHYWPSPDPSGDWSGYGLGAAYRFYIADSRALTGLSVAPAADLFFFRETLFNTSQRTAICFDVGADLAYKWIFDQFAVEPILGLRVGFGPNVSPNRATGTEPLIGVSGGYAWE
ncbi:MAG: hypothetical protein ACHQNE_10350 [Candidatus Kapaibacterium sp.]